MFTDLQTKRICLKLISTEDREFIYSLFSNGAVNRYLYDAEPLKDINGADDIIAFYLNADPVTQCRWILVRKSDGQKMGTCGFHRLNDENRSIEVGYDLLPDYWGQGYMQEALTVIIAFAFGEMEMENIDACISIDNERSETLAKRLGFAFCGRMKDEIFREKRYPHRIYTLHKNEARLSGAYGDIWRR